LRRSATPECTRLYNISLDVAANYFLNEALEVCERGMAQHTVGLSRNHTRIEGNLRVVDVPVSLAQAILTHMRDDLLCPGVAMRLKQRRVLLAVVSGMVVVQVVRETSFDEIEVQATPVPRLSCLVPM